MEHKIIDLKEIEKLLSFIRQNHKALKDDADRDTFHDILGYLETAKPLADNNKYATCLYDAATKYVNQLAFRLYIEEGLTEEAAKVFRGFEPVKTVAGYARVYADEDKERADAITKQQQEYMQEHDAFDVFKGVIGGLSLEEAEQKMEAYKQRQAAAMQNAVQNGQI